MKNKVYTENNEFECALYMVDEDGTCRLELEIVYEHMTEVKTIYTTTKEIIDTDMVFHGKDDTVLIAILMNNKETQETSSLIYSVNVDELSAEPMPLGYYLYDQPNNQIVVKSISPDIYLYGVSGPTTQVINIYKGEGDDRRSIRILNPENCTLYPHTTEVSQDGLTMAVVMRKTDDRVIVKKLDFINGIDTDIGGANVHYLNGNKKDKPLALTRDGKRLMVASIYANGTDSYELSTSVHQLVNGDYRYITTHGGTPISGTDIMKCIVTQLLTECGFRMLVALDNQNDYLEIREYISDEINEVYLPITTLIRRTSDIRPIGFDFLKRKIKSV